MAAQTVQSLNRCTFSSEAEQDLDGILAYLGGLPDRPAQRISHSLETMFHSIAEHPYLGKTHSGLTLTVGEEFRSRLAESYRIYYRLGSRQPEIVAILHGAQDHAAVLDLRFR